MEVKHQVHQVAIYCRVSKKDGSQDTARQVAALQEAARSKGWEVVDVIQEMESGRVRRRAGTAKLVAMAQAGRISKVLIEEPKRLGRNTPDAVQTWDDLSTFGVSIFVRQAGQETLDDRGRQSHYSLTVFLLSLGVAQLDNQERSENIIQGLREARRKGKVLGRPKGSFDRKLEKKILCLLAEERYSIRQIAALAGCSKNTVSAVKFRNVD